MNTEQAISMIIAGYADSQTVLRIGITVIRSEDELILRNAGKHRLLGRDFTSPVEVVATGNLRPAAVI